MRRDQLFSLGLLLTITVLMAVGISNLNLTNARPVSTSSTGQAIEPGAVTGEQVRYSVERVVDGDTIIVHGLLDSIRLIGIDTPELNDSRSPVRCFAQLATLRLTEIVGNEEVLLERDVEDRDRYHRFLRYVYLPDGTFVNLVMAKDGYANPLTIPPNLRYAPLFFAGVQEARSAERGLWNRSMCS